MPKTLKAIKGIGKRLSSFLTHSKKRVKRFTKVIDRKAARNIRTLTKRHLRK